MSFKICFCWWWEKSIFVRFLKNCDLVVEGGFEPVNEFSIRKQRCAEYSTSSLRPLDPRTNKSCVITVVPGEEFCQTHGHISVTHATWREHMRSHAYTTQRGWIYHRITLRLAFNPAIPAAWRALLVAIKAFRNRQGRRSFVNTVGRKKRNRREIAERWCLNNAFDFQCSKRSRMDIGQ